MPSVNLHGGNDVRFDADHDVSLYPIVLFPNLAVLVIEPTRESASSEAGRIDGKISFNGLQRQAAFGNQALQHSGQIGILERIRDAVEMRNLGDVPAPMRLSRSDMKRRCETVL